MLKEFFVGLGYLKPGVALALQPGLRPYLVIPVVANMLLFGLMGFYVFSHFGGWIDWLQISNDLPDWLSWLAGAVSWLNGLLHALAWLVLGVTMLLLTAYTFTSITQILISPFLSVFAEQVERRLHTPDYPQHGWVQIALRSFKRELHKFFYWGIRAVGLGVVSLILLFIPGVNVLNPVLWTLFGAWVMALQYIDIVADNNGQPFQKTLEIMRQRRYLTLGFGGVVLALTTIPIVNLFIIPVAVAAAVKLWVDVMNDQKTAG